jgi:hypothetical protein
MTANPFPDKLRLVLILIRPVTANMFLHHHTQFGCTRDGEADACRNGIWGLLDGSSGCLLCWAVLWRVSLYFLYRYIQSPKQRCAETPTGCSVLGIASGAPGYPSSAPKGYSEHLSTRLPEQSVARRAFSRLHSYPPCSNSSPPPWSGCASLFGTRRAFYSPSSKIRPLDADSCHFQRGVLQQGGCALCATLPSARVSRADGCWAGEAL